MCVAIEEGTVFACFKTVLHWLWTVSNKVWTADHDCATVAHTVDILRTVFVTTVGAPFGSEFLSLVDIDRVRKVITSFRASVSDQNCFTAEFGEKELVHLIYIFMKWI